jgi:hypothetical protein
METDTENKDFKRMVAWKGLKIISITLGDAEVVIQARRNRKTYYIFCKDHKMTIKDADMKVLDEISVPEESYKFGTAANPWGSNLWTYTSSTSEIPLHQWQSSFTSSTIKFE